jgi:hypothetical protein
LKTHFKDAEQLFDSIDANELEFDENDISTGKIIPHCVSALDKLQIVEKYLSTSKEGTNLYIGDSAITDLLCCIHPSITGILMSPKESTLKICTEFGVNVFPVDGSLSSCQKFTVFRCSSWTELESFVFDTKIKTETVQFIQPTPM